MAKVEHHCGKGAKMDRHIKGEPLIRPVGHVGKEDQVGRTGDGQKFCKSLK